MAELVDQVAVLRQVHALMGDLLVLRVRTYCLLVEQGVVQTALHRLLRVELVRSLAVKGLLLVATHARALLAIESVHLSVARLLDQLPGSMEVGRS